MNRATMAALISSSRRRGYVFTDSDAAAYSAAVDAQDGQESEDGVKAARDSLFLGLKADGEWNNIVALRCYAGPRTLLGCAVPMKGVAPTLVNFVSGDINRKNGLLGDGTTKYVDHNRNNNADGQNSQQMWSYLTALPTSGSVRGIIGAGGASDAGATRITEASGIPRAIVPRNRNSTSETVDVLDRIAIGLIGMSRSSSTTFQLRAAQSTTNYTRTSQTPYNGNIFSFALNTGTATNFADSRHAFDGIGAAWTNPANIETRLAAYLTAINTAIP